MEWRSILGVCVVLLVGAACAPTDPLVREQAKKSPPKKPAIIVLPVLTTEENDRRNKISREVCSSCHVWPKPGVLNRKAWVEVLDKMKPWLGLEPIPDDMPEELHGLFPSEKVIDAVQWTELKEYYLVNAPRDFPVVHAKFDGEAKLFEAVDAKAPSGAFYMTLRVEPKTGVIWAGWEGGGGDHGVFHGDANGKWSEVLDWGGAPAQFRFTGKGVLAVMIGDLIPSNEAAGGLVRVEENKPVELMKFLRRPVDVLVEDFDGKEPEDFVLCEFGHLMGGITWFGHEGDHSERRSLLDQPGILNAASADLNRDGHLDFAVLVGQAREGVFLFFGDGKGSFEPRAILPRHPSWGHSHLELVDINGDRHPDLLITNGDNGDLLEVPVKPYHGIRIHLNDGKGNFLEEKFFAQPGAYRALAQDFDGDGDMDIASIAYFADFKNSSEMALIYLRQEGPMEFKRLKMPGAQSGRWITMDAGDVDGDNDVDLVLGAMNFGPGVGTVPIKTRRRWVRENLPVLILRNRTR
tara:strand:- start:4518 stop:6080 length:1563 start_codon:yes stop_codon:yes gene_type:complete